MRAFRPRSSASSPRPGRPAEQRAGARREAALAPVGTDAPARVERDAERPEPHATDGLHEVGRIVGAWGVKGWIKVQPHADDPQALLEVRRWTLAAPEPQPRACASAQSLAIVQARRHGDFVLAQAEGVVDRNAADALRGRRVCIARAAFPLPPADAYYWVDLIGLSVVNREGVELGAVAGLIETGAHAVLRVRPSAADAEERLIPFVGAYVDDVDLAAGRVRVDWGVDY